VGSPRCASAQVSEIETLGDQILVGLVLAGTQPAGERGGHATRWQLLTVRKGRVVDIVGFDQRSEAVAFAEAAPAG
jgi:hypothetical protein